MHQKNSGRKTTLKGKIKPPQLNGKKVGILSTRTPHRPNSIGLSVAKIARVNILKRKVDLLHRDAVGVIDAAADVDHGVKVNTVSVRWLRHGAVGTVRVVAAVRPVRTSKDAAS